MPDHSDIINIFPLIETAFLTYFKALCDTEGLAWYKTMDWLEAQPDDQGNPIGITAPFISILCGDLVPAAPGANLDDPNQTEAGTLSVLIRTLAKDIYSDPEEKQLVMTGLELHNLIVGKIKGQIFFARNQATRDRIKLEAAINALNVPGVTIFKVSRPSQTKPAVNGSTYETDIRIPFQAGPKAA
jgi:hypothetical protein